MVDRNVPDAAVGYRAILAIDENGDTGEVICNPSPMGEANSRLIAAAPEMLEALKRIKETGVFLGAIAREMMDEAIAKATGGAP
jgi:hypothetical protein